MPIETTFAALGDPTRRDIVEQLGNGAATVGELAKRYPISQPAVTKHLNILEQAGLIRRTRSGRTVLCELVPEPLRDAHSMLESMKSHWESVFDRLGDVLEEDEQ